MNSENLPKPDNDQYDPNLEAQDEEVTSGGNNRLLYILAGVVLVLVLGYVALPKGNGEGLASATPSFMLDDAAVTATAPTAADSVAAGLQTAPAAQKAPAETPAAAAKPATVRATTAAPAPAASVGTALEPVAPTVAALAPEPVLAPAPVTAPAPAAAPANVTMSGRIVDENGRPLVGATVLLKGSSKGTSTDATGNYTLEVPNGSDNTLIYGYGGYDDEVLRSRGSQFVNVTLMPRADAGRKRR
ncbi:carboxypeptidase-like regulatory domain-containing protein [Hymenobacter sp.]|uniref:carboxypeptidase-like regulatory domain-containing protein n=1 Tax=Hymenobacter sp. TaxID=1898978 RepID=UPI00286ADFBA|nr:carboxypeptidase-like regulatory domain-containing protein [Hymenobacter sp.]